MKKRTVLFFLLIWLAGCASAQEAEEQTKWVNSEQKVIENGIRYESITKDDIIDKIDLNGEQVVVFRFGDSEGEGIGLAHIKRENGNYQWYRDLNYAIVKSDHPKTENAEASAPFTTPKGRKYTLYTGDADRLNGTFETDDGLHLEPVVDQKTGMYYQIVQDSD
ncbi:hypothetical protein MOE82_16370 [Bacillus licheniformis]|uniref:hypothetical protein n=1 Tax=Bacillus licheniformis TaxID=1402 RepID=UPI00227EB649|nr:hypothetical protein [Bacillus licheniformis]MCY7774172.1 hypothetical protein [Bacillus licheniformis]MCY7957098.1 hypothetical protein [Bacillus licheniformis]MCY8158420.1 hypothetical protein [Bacillus licheniformis]MCY8530925.1 hypothetical protein [Bacillus licheniformis]MCY8745379.1 hypothetical protein [Bacillus licheniformis]